MRHRRTGITLKEGKRDEHGMEEIDGLFSSPEKSAVKENGFSHHGNETMMGSDGMSMDEGMPRPFQPSITCLTLDFNSQAMLPVLQTFSMASMANAHPTSLPPKPALLGHLAEHPVCDLQVRNKIRLPPARQLARATGESHDMMRLLSHIVL